VTLASRSPFSSSIRPIDTRNQKNCGRLDAAGGFLGFVDDQVAIVERLDAEEVEFQVGRGVERGAEFGEVVVEQTRVKAFDGDAVLEIFLEGALVEVLQFANAVAEDVPTEHFLVEVGELDAAGKLGEVSVFFDQSLRIEDDRGIEVLLGNLVVDGAAELELDLLVVEAEIEADAGKLDAFAEVGAVPENVFAGGGLDDDEGGLAGSGGGGQPARGYRREAKEERKDRCGRRRVRRGIGCRRGRLCSGRPS